MGAAAQTPPPSSHPSDAPTFADASPLPGTPAPPPLSDSHLLGQQLLPLGSVLGGRYLILRILGEGGMGAVYQARDQELDRLIALKVIRPELAGNPAILQRFKQELILARNVTHKNVVRIYDMGEAGGIKYITMEFVEGEDLRTLLRRHGKVSAKEAVEIVKQICRALDAAHSEGVIHRDLKPQNVMRDTQGRVVVMDFGLARSLESPGMTQTGALVGTLEYMSPEQALGGDLDQRSDLFAVGLIFFELLTGKVPYKADTAIASLMKRTQERALSAWETDNTVPKAVSAIVAKCLERDPNARCASAAELLQQLEAWQANPKASLSTVTSYSQAAPRSVQISLNLPGSKTWVPLAAAAVLLVAFFAIPRTRHLLFPASPVSQSSGGISGIPDLSKGKYVAILPLRVAGDEKSLRYVADGLVDALSAKMFQLKEVHLAAPSAVEKEAGKDQPAEKIARALGVNLILQGTVQGGADKLRITLSLEDLAHGRQVWSQEFSGVTQDLLTLEDQVYSNVVQALELRPSNEELARGGVHPTENMAAYDLYLKGRDALRGNQGVRDMKAAIGYLESALRQDPNFALAYAGLSDANMRMYRESKDPLYAEKALAAAQNAARINPNLPEVYLSLGSVYNATGKNAQAVEELKRALALAPNSDDAYRRLGDAYLAGGKTHEALSAYQAAVDANPYYWYNHNKLGTAYFQTGDAGKALEAYRQVTQLAPENAIGFQNMGAVYFRQGNWSGAIPAFQKALELEPAATIYSNLGTAYFYLQRYSEAVPMFEKAVELSPKDEQLTGNLADAYRWSGRTDDANRTYDKAIQLSFQELQVNPRSASATGDVGLYYAKKGDFTHGTQYLRQARSLDPSDLQLICYQAQVFTLAGKQAEALATLKEAFQKGYTAEEAMNEPELGKLKGLPEFSKLVKEYSGQGR
ncbi:MAG: tetratricopeptide repeat protein [Acidobacteria bacterium]|nr:tetratricopeptide repeat protein [Acidobacteriota bacterium]